MGSTSSKPLPKASPPKVSDLKRTSPIIKEASPPEAKPTSPPAYATTDNKSAVPVTETRIQASDVPQWSWNNAQCRQWIESMCLKGGMSQRKAKMKAGHFDGFGPNLWMNDWNWWNGYYGQNGCAIYAILLVARNKKGAVPGSVWIPGVSGCCK